jgi:hypothetical protein
VVADRNAVGRDPDIDLDAVRALPQRAVHRGKGVLGRCGVDGTAMSEKKHTPNVTADEDERGSIA